MPAYLCHGFRWHRRSVRVYVVVQNLDDASPEWIIPAKSSQCLLESFYNLFDFLPYCVPPPRSGSSGYGSTLRTGEGGSDDESYVFNANTYGNGGSQGNRSRSQSAAGQKSRSQSRTRSRQASNAPLPLPAAREQQLNAHGLPAEDELKAQEWSAVKLLEEYDPLKLDEVSRPYAYVADYAVKIDLSASIFDEIARYEERVRADRDPPISGPTSDEGVAAAGSKKKGSKKEKQSSGAAAGGTGWFEKLRDQLQRGEEIRWYVVVNGDEVRDWPDEPDKNSVKATQRPAPTRAQQEHHSQYMLQQQILEDNDGKKVVSVYTEKGSGRRDRGKSVNVPEKELPPLRTKMSVDGSGGHGHGHGHGHRPKTPSKSGFRRLFGRNKAEDMSP